MKELKCIYEGILDDDFDASILTTVWNDKLKNCRTSSNFETLVKELKQHLDKDLGTNYEENIKLVTEHPSKKCICISYVRNITYGGYGWDIRISVSERKLLNLFFKKFGIKNNIVSMEHPLGDSIRANSEAFPKSKFYVYNVEGTVWEH